MLKVVSIHNFIGISECSMTLEKKISIVTGMNGAGKSSIAAAIEWALTGKARQLEFKKDNAGLIHQGAKTAEVVLTFDDMTIRRSRTASAETLRVINDGKPEQKELPTTIKNWSALALNPLAYFDMSIEERKAALGAVLLKDPDAAAIQSLLVKRYQIPDEFAEAFAALAVKDGFDEAADEAVLKRREMKRDIDALNAEAPSPSLILAGNSYNMATIDPALVAEQLDGVRSERDGLLQEKGAAQAPVATKMSGPTRAVIDEALVNAKAELAALIKPDASQAELERSITDYEAEIAKWEQKIREAQAAIKVSDAEGKLQIPNLEFTKCPVMEQINCPVPMADRKKLLKTFESRKRIGEQIIAENNDAIRLATSEIDACRRKINTARADMNDARDYEMRDMAARSAVTALTQALATATDEPEPEPEPQRDFNSEIAALDDRIKIGEQLLSKIEQFKADSERSAAAITDSKELTERVEMYDRLAGALAPGGIPLELMREGLKRFAGRLATASAIFDIPIALGEGDFLPVYNNRPYRLCSESEQWRARIALQEAIAFWGKVPYLILDGADILDRELKQAFAGFLMSVAEHYDRIFVFATESDVPPTTSTHPDVQQWQVSGGIVKSV